MKIQRTLFTALPALFLVGLLTPILSAEVKLASIFSDHLVLQRDMELPVWGTANVGEEVTVTIADQSHSATADEAGNWRVMLQPLQTGEPLTLTASGTNKVDANDILVGEVWLCSGQSNMQWIVRNSWNADMEIPKANHPQIRLLTVNTPAAQKPLKSFPTKWEICTPKTVKDFSAVGYHFGLELHERLGVPIGLIDNAWGGSACEAWVRRDHLDADPMYEALIKRWKEQESKHEEAMADWKQKRDEAKAAGKKEPKRPNSAGAMAGNKRPANLYHGRLMPIMPYGIRGTIWYQGESNASRAYQYRDLFPLMIRTWRATWNKANPAQGDFPFYWVQLADFMREQPKTIESAWAELREAQTMTLDREPNTGQAVIIDIGEGNDIHPRNKIEVARRLARIALAKDYGIEIAHLSPRFEQIDIKEGKAIVTLKAVGGGLRTVDSRNVEGFTIAGEDKKWHLAKAKILGKNQVEVSSDAEESPVAVRYAWADNPVCNLYTKTGLPVTPFRTDEWKGVTAEKQ